MREFYDIDADEYGFATCDMLTRFDGSKMLRVSDFSALDLNTGEIHLIQGLEPMERGEFSNEEFDWMDD